MHSLVGFRPVENTFATSSVHKMLSEVLLCKYDGGGICYFHSVLLRL